MQDRHVPLIVIASVTASSLADAVATQLRREGNVVYVTHSADGCLRVATSVGPDLVLLDPDLPRPRRLEQLLRAHPRCAGTRILHLAEGVARPSFSLTRVA